MRIDQLLNKLCLTKTRSIAKNACDKNLVEINGKPAKASAEVKAGDQVRFRLYGFEYRITITQIPTGNVSKVSAPKFYEIVSRTALPAD